MKKAHSSNINTHGVKGHKISSTTPGANVKAKAKIPLSKESIPAPKNAKKASTKEKNMYGTHAKKIKK